MEVIDSIPVDNKYEINSNKQTLDMKNIDMNSILNREEKAKQFKEILTLFPTHKNLVTFKKGIYVYGEPGTGKTTFVIDLLKELDYDIVKYDAGDIRNKSIIDTITHHNMADKNIISMFHRKVKKIAIVMDEIDGMNNGDKGGINTLIKLIRPKKTKKQKLEETCLNPIICIGNNYMDKKIKELMKVCHIIELVTPTNQQVENILVRCFPNLQEKVNKNANNTNTNINSVTKNTSQKSERSLIESMTSYIQGDLRKLDSIVEIYKELEISKNKKEDNKDNMFSLINGDIDIFNTIFQKKTYSDDTKKITKRLLNNYFSLNEHNAVMNETDRTIIGLLWHENIIDVLGGKIPKNVSMPFYLSQLENICFADYIDRITFQKQIWQFNEMSSLIKTFKNNKMYHDTFKKKPKYNPIEVRFTKVLTKYSTEYNNLTFIQNLCQILDMDRKDMLSCFLELRNKYNGDENAIFELFTNYDITKLDISRLYRYIDKYVKDTCLDDEPSNGVVDSGDIDNETE
jgi:Cdc6-like AAA superfamily ATPase